MATTKPAAKSTGNRPYSGRPRQRRPVASDFDDPSRAPTPAERRRIDEEQSRPYRESYEEGRKRGREDARSTKKPSQSKQPARRAPARRRAAPGARSARTAVRQLQAPVRAQVTSGLRIFGLTLAVVALYNILTGPGPDAFSGVLNGVSKALDWLGKPTAIPERH
jgi:hypothetical protein